MPRARYSQWKGPAVPSTGADQVFDELNKHMNETGDLQQAIRRLLQRGMGEGDEKIPGLEDLLSQVAREMRKMYERYQLPPALDEVEKKLQSVVSRERETLEQLKETKSGMEEKKSILDQLPNKLSDAVEKLASYSFEDAQAESEFQELLSQLEPIKRLENYIRREGNLFRGQTPLEFKDAQELLDRIEGLHALEDRLSGANLEHVDRDLLRRLLGEQSSQQLDSVAQMEALLEEGGYILDRSDHFELTPRGVRRIGNLALRDIYRQLTRDGMGRHSVNRRGSQELRMEGTKRYAHGDPLYLDMTRTLKNALLREGRSPLKLHPHDFEVYESDHLTHAATVLLLDMSWSMSWDGRFAAAKKVALAMESLSRSLYPRDYFGIVGFFTRAVELKLKDLPEATWNMGDPFTNLQEGLHLASELLERRPSRNQQVIIVTDGQPTAYCRQGRLYCEWPLSFGGISQRAAAETLKEAERITRKGITINTFMLDDSPVLKGFVEEMTRLNKGRAFYTRPDRLGEYLLVDYLSHIRKRA